MGHDPLGVDGGPYNSAGVKKTGVIRSRCGPVPGDRWPSVRANRG